jgi:hypothetical protein
MAQYEVKIKATATAKLEIEADTADAAKRIANDLLEIDEFEIDTDHLLCSARKVLDDE